MILDAELFVLDCEQLWNPWLKRLLNILILGMDFSSKSNEITPYMYEGTQRKSRMPMPHLSRRITGEPKEAGGPLSCDRAPFLSEAPFDREKLFIDCF
jgi:hypothetical protein